MARPSVYVETTVISYLAARRSRNIVTAGHQRVTREWWRTRRRGFDLFTSVPVVREAAAGNPRLARARSRLLGGIPVLEVIAGARSLAARLVDSGPIPQKAALDALHIAIATCHGIDYLLTWNCRHIANAQFRAGIEEVCRAAGFDPPILTTPEELMEPPHEG